MKIQTGRDRKPAMADWIDRFLADDKESTEREALRRQTLQAMGARYWEALCQRLRRDAAKLNQEAIRLLKSELEINKRELIPHNNEIDIDRLAYPAIRLTIILNLPAECITIKQSRIETPEGSYRETQETLQLTLTNGQEIAFIDQEGTQLDLDRASQYILGRFLRN